MSHNAGEVCTLSLELQATYSVRKKVTLPSITGLENDDNNNGGLVDDGEARDDPRSSQLKPEEAETSPGAVSAQYQSRKPQSSKDHFHFADWFAQGQPNAFGSVQK